MDFCEQQKEAAQIRKDMSAAHSLIMDALSRYKKKKLGARSKKLAEDMKLLFADLEIYESKVDIQNAYGYESISEKEYYRLLDLWDKREQYMDESGRFTDRVSEMVLAVLPMIGTEYFDFLDQAKEMNDENERNIKEAGAIIQKSAYEHYQRSYMSGKEG